MTQQIYVFSPHVLESRRVLDSGFQSSGFRIPGTGFQSLSVELGYWILIVSGIQDSLSCIFWDPKANDSGFHKQNVPGFRIQQAKRFPYMGRIFNNPVI